MNNLGLKLWSINSAYVKDALLLFEKGFYNYIELYAVPGTFMDFIGLWKKLKVPYIIHAAHSTGGLNPSVKNDREKNKMNANEAIRFADALNAGTIIFHPGIEGSIEETIFQLKSFNDQRIIIENKPYYALNGKQRCLGYSPEQIIRIKDLVGINFCFDIGHCIYSANAQKIQPLEYIKEFLFLSPVLYHLSDGDFSGLIDKHYHFGKGDFPLSEIMGFLNKNIPLSIETEKNSKTNLFDFADDVIYLRKLCREKDPNFNY